MHTKQDLAESKSEATVAARLVRAVVLLGNDMDRGAEEEGHIRAFRIRAPRYMDDEFLMVAYRESEDGTPQVTFHAASSAGEVLVGFSSRLRNGSLKWHTDKYANGQEAEK